MPSERTERRVNDRILNYAAVAFSAPMTTSG